MWPPVGRGAERSKTPMLSRPRNPPWKTFLPCCVLAVDPPGEVQEQLVEDALEEPAVPLVRPLLVDLVDAPRRPGVHGRVHVAEAPTRRPGAGRSGACTTRAGAGRAAAWRSRGRRERAGCSGTPGPRRRTTGTPTCRASRRRRRCRGASTRSCVRGVAPSAARARPGRRAASVRRRSGRTAWTRASRRRPAAARRGRPPRDPASPACRRRRSPRGFASSKIASKSRPNGSSGTAARESRRRTSADSPAGIVEDVAGRALRSHAAQGSRPPARRE